MWTFTSSRKHPNTKMTKLRWETITEGSWECLCGHTLTGEEISGYSTETMTATGDCLEVKLFSHFPPLCCLCVFTWVCLALNDMWTLCPTGQRSLAVDMFCSKNDIIRIFVLIGLDKYSVHTNVVKRNIFKSNILEYSSHPVEQPIWGDQNGSLFVLLIPI